MNSVTCTQKSNYQILKKLYIIVDYKQFQYKLQQYFRVYDIIISIVSTHNENII